MKTKALILCLVLICLFTGCAGRNGGVSSVPMEGHGQIEVNTAPSAVVSDSAVSASEGPEGDLWTGVGGYYILKPTSIADNTLLSLVCNGRLYHLTLDLENGLEYVLQSDKSAVYRWSGEILQIVADGDFIWAVENDFYNNRYYLYRIDSGGKTEAFPVDSSVFTGRFLKQMLVTNGGIILSFNGQLAILDSGGSLLKTVSLPENVSSLTMGANDAVYLVENTDDKCRLYLLDNEYNICDTDYELAAGKLYPGSDGSQFLLETAEGLFSVDVDGTSSALVIWEECSLPLTGSEQILVVEEGYFVEIDSNGYILVPAEYEEKITLTIACLGDSDLVRQRVLEYNYLNSGFQIEMVDYTEGGDLPEDQALIDLNTEIMAGNYPDMILFGESIPESYISKGILSDLEVRLNADDEISKDDIAIANALDRRGGIYYLGSRFYISTMIGQYSRFGNSFGWSFDEYKSIEREKLESTDMLYNATREGVLTQICIRYIIDTVDFGAGTCDFGSDRFVELLEDIGTMEETGEDIDTSSTKRVGSGTLVASGEWVGNVWQLAFEESVAGCRLSFVGWPTIDGECGSMISLVDPISIVSQSLNGDECWRFIKYCLVSDISGMALPTYAPNIELLFRSAMDGDTNLPTDVTTQDQQRLLELISVIDKDGFYDSTILNIVLEESEAFFAGSKTARQTAAIIQNRVQTYLFEQG